MKTAYILHGDCDEDEYFEMDFPSPSNAHWLPWLQQKFLRSGILCQCLEMPLPPHPSYAAWENTFQQVQLQADSILVGHSSGCGFILKWLSQHPQICLDKLILVAPWLDPFEKFPNFLQGSLDATLLERIKQIHILFSTDEVVEGVAESKDILLQTFPSATLHTFADKEHFCLDRTGPTFPELWDIINAS